MHPLLSDPVYSTLLRKHTLLTYNPYFYFFVFWRPVDLAVAAPARKLTFVGRPPDLAVAAPVALKLVPVGRLPDLTVDPLAAVVHGPPDSSAGVT